MGLPLDERQFDAVKVRARLERRIDEFLAGVQSLSAWCALWSSTSFVQYAGDALRGQACIELEVWRPVVEVIANLEGAKARARETAPCRDVAGSAPRSHRAANCGSAEDVNGLSFAELRLFMSSPLIGNPTSILLESVKMPQCECCCGGELLGAMELWLKQRYKSAIDILRPVLRWLPIGLHSG